jgi:hypothetical protein
MSSGLKAVERRMVSLNESGSRGEKLDRRLDERLEHR